MLRIESCFCTEYLVLGSRGNSVDLWHDSEMIRRCFKSVSFATENESLSIMNTLCFMYSLSRMWSIICKDLSFLFFQGAFLSFTKEEHTPNESRIICEIFLRKFIHECYVCRYLLSQSRLRKTHLTLKMRTHIFLISVASRQPRI